MNYIIESELFKPVTIKGFEHYLVSNQGRVSNSRTGRFLKPGLSGGYPCVVLYNEGVKITITVHRLVGLSWIPNPDNKKTINHIDGVKTNNRVENLEWMTHQENMQHAHKTGLVKAYHKDKLLADKEKIEEMLLKDLTYVEIAKVYDCSINTISRFVMDNNLQVSNYSSRITDDQIQEAYELLSKGKSLSSIGRALGVSYQVVRRHLNKFYGKDHIDELMLIKIN